MPLFFISSNAECFTELYPVEADDAQDQPIAIKSKGVIELNLGRVVKLEAYLSSDIFCDIISTTQLEQLGFTRAACGSKRDLKSQS